MDLTGIVVNPDGSVHLESASKVVELVKIILEDAQSKCMLVRTDDDEDEYLLMAMLTLKGYGDEYYNKFAAQISCTPYKG